MRCLHIIKLLFYFRSVVLLANCLIYYGYKWLWIKNRKSVGSALIHTYKFDRQDGWRRLLFWNNIWNLINLYRFKELSSDWSVITIQRLEYLDLYAQQYTPLIAVKLITTLIHGIRPTGLSKQLRKKDGLLEIWKFSTNYFASNYFRRNKLMFTRCIFNKPSHKGLSRKIVLTGIDWRITDLFPNPLSN